MRKIQSQGVHHITLVGADRQTSIDFWDGVLGMPFVFEQPNLDNPNGHPLIFGMAFLVCHLCLNSQIWTIRMKAICILTRAMAD